MLKIAIVGGGYISQNHIGAYKAMTDVQVAAVICRNQEHGETVCRETGENCHYYATLEAAAAAEKIDVVDICTPTSTHEDYVVRAAKLKCHVICEKPVTFDLESFDRMYQACRENHVLFMVAQVARWWPEFLAIKEAVTQGKLGNIHMIYEKRICQHPAWSTWHRDPAISGRGLYDLNVHDIDFLYSLLGMPSKIYANGWKSPTGCWNHVVTNLTWSSGEKAVCETSLEMTGNYPFSIEFRGTGDAGTLCYSMTAGMNINDGDRGCDFMWYPANQEEVCPIEVEQTDMFAGELRGFLEAVMHKGKVPVTPEESREVLKIVLAIKKSLEEGIVIIP